MQKRGNIISFEGGEGSGKSTVVKEVVEHLAKQGKRVRLVREPGGSEVAEEIRELIVGDKCKGMCYSTELLLFVASRVELLKHTTIPAICNGEIVIYDRFIDSSIVYQGVVRGLGIELVMDLHKLMMNDWFPNFSILLDVDAETGLKRATQEGVETNRFEEESIEFHKKVNKAYVELFEKYRNNVNNKIEIIDANSEKEVVLANVIKAVEKFLM